MFTQDPTESITVLKPPNPFHEISELHKDGPTPDFAALNL